MVSAAASPSVANPSTVEAEVIRIRELLESRRYADAEAAARALAVRVPENRDVLYSIAVSLRYLTQDPRGARDALERLERFIPKFSRLYQERGHCYVALKDAPRAIDAFLRAVQHQPGAACELVHARGPVPHDRADRTMRPWRPPMSPPCKHLPPEVVTATSLFSDGELLPAENIVRAYLLKHGNHIEAMRLLARIGMEREVLDDAELLLEAVLQLAPDYQRRALRLCPRAGGAAQVLSARASNSRRSCKLEPAQQTTTRPSTPPRASVSASTRRPSRSTGSCSSMRRGRPICTCRWPMRSRPSGRREESIEAYRAAAAARPNYGDAYWSLANLKTYRFTDEEIARHARRGSRRRPRDSSIAITCASRSARHSRIAASMRNRGAIMSAATPSRRSESRYRPGDHRDQHAAADRGLHPRVLREPRGHRATREPDPIFIVGLPRAGSTLLEQILASHSHVEGTQELADIPRIVARAAGTRSRPRQSPLPAACSASMAAGGILRLGEKYLDDTRVYRERQAARSSSTRCRTTSGTSASST